MAERPRYDCLGQPFDPLPPIDKFARPPPAVAPLPAIVTAITMLTLIASFSVALRVLRIDPPIKGKVVSAQIPKDQTRFITGMEPVLMVKEE